jgi:tetratricopeptide (TPR) repeat protein
MEEKEVKPKLENPPEVTRDPEEKPRLGDFPEEPQSQGKKSGTVLEEFTPEERKKLLNEVADEFYLRGEKSYANGNLKESQEFLERALTLNPQHNKAKLRLNLVLKKLEPPPTPKPAVSVKDTKSVLISKLEKELDRWVVEKNWDNTEAAAKKLLAVDPGNGKAKTRLQIAHKNLALRAFNRGETREKQGDFQGAVDAYRVAVSYDPSQELSEKINSLSDKINESNSRRSDDIYLQALEASQAAAYEKAIDLCRQAIQLNPNNIQAQRMLERLKSRVKS